MAVNRELQALQAQRRARDEAERRQAILAAIARQQKDGGQGLQLSPMQTASVQRRAAAPKAGANPFDAAYETDKANGLVRGGGGGGGGFNLGGALAGIGKGALTALDLGRRASILGIETMADVLPEPLEYINPLAPALLLVDEDREDDRSWLDKLGDSEYGAGQVFRKTGNKWLDRGIGFVGDVALDPLTYLTFGTAKFAGSAGRAALAGEAIAKNVAERAAGKAAMFTDEVIEGIARQGEHALSAAQREALNLEKAGLRFGLNSKSVRIPGTGFISEGGGKTLSALRGTMTDSPIGRGARRLGGSRQQATRELMESFATGRGPISRTKAAATLRALAEEEGIRGEVLGKLAPRIRKDANDYAGKRELFHAVEAGQVQGTERIREATKQLLELQRQYGVPINERQNYMPHYNLEPLEELLGRAGSDEDLIIPAFGGGSGRLNPRKFEPGKTVKIAGKDVTFDTATAADITAKIQEQFPELLGVRLIEDDPGVILPRLLEDAAKDSGRKRFNDVLESLDQLLEVNDPRVTTRGALNQAATDEARAAAARELGIPQELEELGLRRENLAGEGQSALDEAHRIASEEATAGVDVARQQAEVAQRNLDQYGQLSTTLRGAMGDIATAGEQQLTDAHIRLAQLQGEVERLRGIMAQFPVQERQSKTFAKYMERLQNVLAERAELEATQQAGRAASNRTGVLTRQINRAGQEQIDLAAQVGEGAAGRARAEVGGTLPQRMEEEFFAGAKETADSLQARLEALAGPLEDVNAEGVRLSRQKTATGGASPAKREAHVEQAITKIKGARGLSDGDRAAAARTLKPEQLAEPNILSDAVTNANDPDIVQTFYDTQQALAEALRPYRASDQAVDLAPTRPLASAEMNQQRQAIVSQIEQLEAGMAKARRYIESGVSPRDRKIAEGHLRSFSAKRNELLRELDELSTVSLPRSVEAMADATVAELTDQAARLADYMVRYARGVAKGGDPEAVGARAAREALEFERQEIVDRLRYRLPAEGGATAERRAGQTAERRAAFESPEAVEAEVQRRWERQVADWDATDERALNDAVGQERTARQTYAEEEAKPRRAQEAVDRAKANVEEAKAKARDARNKADAARRRGDPTLEQFRRNFNEFKRKAREAEEALAQRETELRSAQSQWKKFKRDVPAPTAGDVTPVARESEEAFKARVRSSLERATTEAPTKGSTREVASAFELEQRVQELAAPVREAQRNLKRFQRLVETGRLNPGTMGELGIEKGDILELLGREGGGDSIVNAIESQLRTRVFSEQEAYAESMSALLGRRMKAKEAWQYAKKSDDATRRMEDLLGEMSPVGRGRWDTHLKQMSVLDQRRLRDVDNRLARMGEGTAGREVTDKPYFALLASAGQNADPRYALPARDLSQLADQGTLDAINAGQAGVKAARDELVGQQRFVEQAAGAPMDLAVEQRRAFEQRLAEVADQNMEARTDLMNRRRGLEAERAELAPTARAGREAGAALRAQTPGQQMQAQLADELAPMKAEEAGVGAVLGNVEKARDTAARQLAAIPEQVKTDLSAVTAAYEAARGSQLESAVDVAARSAQVQEATTQLADIKSVNPKVKGTAAGDYQNGVDQLSAAVGAGASPEVTSLLDTAAQISAEMADVDEQLAVINSVQQRLHSDKAYEVFETAVMPGYRMLYSNVSGDRIIADDLYRSIENMRNVLFKERGTLGKVVDKYTRFFKAYATATPGFHLRNAMSAAFMNASDGVSARNMAAGMRVWKAFLDAPEDPRWWAKLPERYQRVAQDALTAVYASGAGGAFSAAEIGSRAAASQSKMAKFLLDNRWVKTSQRWGENVEGSVRMGMAIDTLLGGGARERAGGSLSEAIQRINRVHFNYSHVGEMDEMARRVIPFWTFLSRNVPLQMQQMITKPRTYLHYESFVRNFKEPGDDSDLPLYMREGGGFRLTGGLGLMPDLGATQLASQINTLTRPSALLGQTTPAIKVPLQLTTNRQFYYDEPYQENDYQRIPPELMALLPLLAGAGLTKDIPGGGQAVERKYLDAAYDVLPPASLINAIFGTTPNREGKETQARLNKLGIPIRVLDDATLERERNRKRGSEKGAKAKAKAERQALIELARTG